MFLFITSPFRPPNLMKIIYYLTTLQNSFLLKERILYVIQHQISIYHSLPKLLYSNFWNYGHLRIYWFPYLFLLCLKVQQLLFLHLYCFEILVLLFFASFFSFAAFLSVSNWFSILRIMLWKFSCRFARNSHVFVLLYIFSFYTSISSGISIAPPRPTKRSPNFVPSSYLSK